MKIFYFHRFVWKIVVLSIFISLQNVKSQRGGYLYFQFVCFKNPGHRDVNGDVCDRVPSVNCDPYFKICISSHSMPNMDKCPIYYKLSKPYDNHESICDTPWDNRGELNHLIKLEQPYPLPKKFFVRIETTDHDIWTSHVTSIASFKLEFSQIPVPNMGNPKYETLKMFRTEHRYGNPQASLKVKMALQCDYDRYGQYCLDFCRASPSDNYVCSKEGKKRCKKGWKGNNCSKKDPCLSISCIEGAKCIEIEGKADCFCNGQIGRQCFSNYNPCLKEPCKNEGHCIINKKIEIGYMCSCKDPFYGTYCEKKTNLCQLEPCHNNATCYYDNNHARHCVCLQGYFGKLCDQKQVDEDEIKSTTNFYFNSTVGVLKLQQAKIAPIVLSIFIGTVIFIILLIAVYRFGCYRKHRYILKRNNLPPVQMRDLEKKNDTAKVIPNGYFEKFSDDAAYEIVDDKNIYELLLDANDDYLVPSATTNHNSPNSPNAVNSDYLDMKSLITSDKKSSNNIGSQEEPDLPPLPKREFKRKQSFKDKFCFS